MEVWVEVDGDGGGRDGGKVEGGGLWVMEVCVLRRIVCREIFLPHCTYMYSVSRKFRHAFNCI